MRLDENVFFNSIINNEVSSLSEAFQKSSVEDSSDEISLTEKLFKDMDPIIGEHTMSVLRNYVEETLIPDNKVMWGIIFHDSGKAYTRTVDKEGVEHFYGHQARSAELFDEVRTELGILDEDAVHIKDLVRWHDDEIGLKLTREVYARNGREFFDGFIALKRADALDHNEERKAKRLSDIESYIPVLNNRLKLIEKEQTEKIEYYSMRDVILELSLEGPEIGKVRKELDNIASSSETPAKDIELFIKRYKEAKLSHMKDVSEAKKTRDEEKGVTEKLWLDVDGREALFKITQFRPDGTHPNAHYAELFVSELCKALGIPAPEIELAYNMQNIGCLSYNFLEPGDKMTDFNEILSQIRPDFNSKNLKAENTNEAYSIPLILEGLESMSENREEYSRLQEQFLTYCMMYSLIEHYDNNPSNISVIRNRDGIRLAPMFDNGTSLDISIPEQVVKENLSQTWIEELRAGNRSKIGTDKRYCQYNELESYILSKHFKDVEAFLGRLTDIGNKVDTILSSPAYDGLGEDYKKIMRMMLVSNVQNMKNRAQIYKDKADIEKKLGRLTLDDLKTGLNGLIPKLSDMIDIPQRNKYHIKNVGEYCLDTIKSINGSNLSPEKKILVQWAVLFNESGKVDTHEVKEENGKVKDSFFGYSTSVIPFAEKKLKELGFMEDDINTVISLIKSHVYREMSPGAFKAVLSTVGEKNLDLYFTMKDCENANKNPILKKSFDEQLKAYKDGINKELTSNNREIIKILPLKAKNLIGMGLKDKQIGQLQNMLVKYIRETPQIYAYYKARGHVDKYKKDLSVFAQEKAKELRGKTPAKPKEVKQMGNEALSVNDYLDALKKKMTEIAQNRVVSAEERTAEVQKFKELYPSEQEKLVFGAISKGAKEGYKDQIMKIMTHYKSLITDNVPLSNEKLNEVLSHIEKHQKLEELLKDDGRKESRICDAMKDAINELPKYQYRGFMIDQPALTKALAQAGIDLPEPGDEWGITKQLHVTTSFQKDVKTNHEDIGAQAKVAITGLAYDPNKGLALSVELISTASEAAELEFKATKRERQPHVTLAMAPGFKPKEAADLFADSLDNPAKIIKFDKPIEVSASYGGMTPEGEVDILNLAEKAFIELAEKKIEANKDKPYATGLLHANKKDIGDRTVYLKSIIDQRSEGPDNAGSSFNPNKNPEDEYDKYSGILDAMVTSEYKETTKEEQLRGAIAENRRSFEVPIPGKQGVITAEQLPDDAIIYAIDGHGSGSIEFCAAGVEKVPVETTTLIMADFSGYELVVTALPGDVRAPSSLENKGIQEGQRFTKEEAIALAGKDAVIKFVPEEKLKELEAKAEILEGLSQEMMICGSKAPDTQEQEQKREETI